MSPDSITGTTDNAEYQECGETLGGKILWVSMCRAVLHGGLNSVLSKCQTPLYTDTGYGHVVQHHNGQAHNNSTTCIQRIWLPHRNAIAQHLDMSRCWDVANFGALVGEFVVQ